MHLFVVGCLGACAWMGVRVIAFMLKERQRSRNVYKKIEILERKKREREARLTFFFPKVEVKRHP